MSVKGLSAVVLIHKNSITKNQSSTNLYIILRYVKDKDKWKDILSQIYFLQYKSKVITHY